MGELEIDSTMIEAGRHSSSSSSLLSPSSSSSQTKHQNQLKLGFYDGGSVDDSGVAAAVLLLQEKEKQGSEALPLHDRPAQNIFVSADMERCVYGLFGREKSGGTTAGAWKGFKGFGNQIFQLRREEKGYYLDPN